MNVTFEPGQYRARVTRWALVKSKEKKTPQFALTFILLGRVSPHLAEGELEACPEVERTIFRPITEKTASWLLQDLKTLFEYPHERFTPLDPESADAFSFADKEIPVVLGFEEYEGKTREKWNFATGLQLGEPLTAGEARKLDTLFGAALPKKNGRKRPAPADAPSAEASPLPTVI